MLNYWVLVKCKELGLKKLVECLGIQYEVMINELSLYQMATEVYMHVKHFPR